MFINLVLVQLKGLTSRSAIVGKRPGISGSGGKTKSPKICLGLWVDRICDATKFGDYPKKLFQLEAWAKQNQKNHDRLAHMSLGQKGPRSTSSSIVYLLFPAGTLSRLAMNHHVFKQPIAMKSMPRNCWTSPWSAHSASTCSTSSYSLSKRPSYGRSHFLTVTSHDVF